MYYSNSSDHQDIIYGERIDISLNFKSKSTFMLEDILILMQEKCPDYLYIQKNKINRIKDKNDVFKYIDNKSRFIKKMYKNGFYLEEEQGENHIDNLDSDLIFCTNQELVDELLKIPKNNTLRFSEI